MIAITNELTLSATGNMFHMYNDICFSKTPATFHTVHRSSGFGVFIFMADMLFVHTTDCPALCFSVGESLGAIGSLTSLDVLKEYCDDDNIAVS